MKDSDDHRLVRVEEKLKILIENSNRFDDLILEKLDSISTRLIKMEEKLELREGQIDKNKAQIKELDSKVDKHGFYLKSVGSIFTIILSVVIGALVKHFYS